MMKELYLSPMVEMDEFDKKDVIATSPNNGDPVVANETEQGKDWTGNA